MGVLDDVLGPSPSMLGQEGVRGTAAMQGQPQPKKKTQQTPQTPQTAKPAPPVDLSDNPFATPSAPDLSDNPFATADGGGDAGPSPLVQKLHADYKAGHLKQAMAAKSAVDPERRSADVTGSPLDAALGSVVQGGETAVSGIPGGAMALAGIRHLSTGESYHDAQAEQAKEISQYEREHPVASMALKTLAAAPLATKIPGGLVGGGASYGAAANALDPNLDESKGDRLWNTVKGGAEGAAIGKLFGVAGQGVQKLGAATGATDAISNALTRAGNTRIGSAVVNAIPKLGENVNNGWKLNKDLFAGGGDAGDIGAALGTKGAVNSVAADRAALQAAAGGAESPADLLARRVAEGRAVASPLYDAARTQANTLEGAPAAVKARLDEILENANQKALPAPGQSEIERAAAREGLANHDYTAGPAPTLEQAAAHDFTATTPPGEPFRDNGLLQSDFTKERPVNLRAANDVNVRQEAGAPAESVGSGAPDRFTEAENATNTALSNPHVQMQIKSLMGDAPSLKGQDPGSYDVLREVQANMNAEYGKLKAMGQDSGPYWHELNGARADVNAALLAKAPKLAEANATFASEVGIPREGITKGQTMGLNPAGKAAFTKSPDAITSWIEGAKTPAEQAARANAVSEGVGAQIGTKIRAVPLTKGTRGALDLPILSASEAGASGRALLDPERRAALEAALSSMDQRTSSEAAHMAPKKLWTLNPSESVLLHGPSRFDYLAQPGAVGPLRSTANAMQGGSLDLAPFQRGRQTLQQLQDAIRALTVARTGQIAAP